MTARMEELDGGGTLGMSESIGMMAMITVVDYIAVNEMFACLGGMRTETGVVWLLCVNAMVHDRTRGVRSAVEGFGWGLC